MCSTLQFAQRGLAGMGVLLARRSSAMGWGLQAKR
jgi:hypothetical protein